MNDSGAPSAATSRAPFGSRDAQDEAFLQRQLAERDREIVQLRGEVKEARARENDMRISLERASRELGGRAPLNRGAPTSASITAPPGGAAARSDVVLAALRAALSQEQERRELAEHQLTRLKEETSATYTGPRVPEADYLAVKQELQVLRQELADEQAARERLSPAPPPVPGGGAAEPLPRGATNPESADLRVRLQRLQKERDTIVATLNTDLATSRKRVAELEQQLGSAPAATAPDPAAPAASAENAALRAQLAEAHRRTEALTAKLKMAARVNDLIFKMQAQQADAKPARTRGGSSDGR